MEDRDRWLAEMQQFNADTRLKLRQHSTEVWKIVIVSVIATAVVTTGILLTIPSPGGWKACHERRLNDHVAVGHA